MSARQQRWASQACHATGHAPFTHSQHVALKPVLHREPQLLVAHSVTSSSACLPLAQM